MLKCLDDSNWRNLINRVLWIKKIKKRMSFEAYSIITSGRLKQMNHLGVEVAINIIFCTSMKIMGKKNALFIILNQATAS